MCAFSLLDPASVASSLMVVVIVITVAFGSNEMLHLFVSLEEESYSGGGNVTFEGILGSIPYFTKRLFQAKLLLGDPALGFTYSVSHILGFADYLSVNFQHLVHHSFLRMVVHAHSFLIETRE